ncbi:MAG: isoprenyl transferase [Clostridia bacterium]|nr:isoprenyl transferase [Clostridia bacterium]
MHISIIMDGNGRWAKKRLMPRPAGHRAGMKTLHDIVEAAPGLGVKALTVYAFSSENWERPPAEVAALMRLLVEFCERELPGLHKNNVRVRIIGDHSRAPQDAKEAISKAIDLTRENTGLQYTIAFGYGSRAELVRAARLLAETLPSERIDNKALENALYTKDLPPLDLLIRTGGERRLSNFLLYQAAYAELYFTDTLWPDFGPKELEKAIADFQGRQRRFGLV